LFMLLKNSKKMHNLKISLYSINNIKPALKIKMKILPN
jgi:hypothetical protein